MPTLITTQSIGARCTADRGGTVINFQFPHHYQKEVSAFINQESDFSVHVPFKFSFS